MKILIAEDDPISHAILERTLRSWGHEVVATHDGAAAWDVLQSQDPPKLAILDWMMPKLDGKEVCRRLRQLAAPDSTYVILLTARFQKDDVAAGHATLDLVVAGVERRHVERSDAVEVGRDLVHERGHQRLAVGADRRG